jgi:hypothetical protein
MIRQIDSLHQEQWYFYYDDSNQVLYLNKYYLMYRETTRHKWKTEKKYDRIDSRYSTLTQSEVPFSEDIKAQALQEYIQGIAVRLWDRG